MTAAEKRAAHERDSQRFAAAHPDWDLPVVEVRLPPEPRRRPARRSYQPSVLSRPLRGAV